MNYAKMNDQEREAFDKARSAAVAILESMHMMKTKPEAPSSIWEIHKKAIEITAAAYNIHNRIYR